ncbi:MAG: histidine utilization repressor [Kiloniellaceae bacterium]
MIAPKKSKPNYGPAAQDQGLRPRAGQSAEPRPLYQSIKSYVIDHIESGAWAPGARIPSESEISGFMAASRMTVNRAIRELTAEGRVTRIQGVGTFVAKPRQPATLLNIRSIGDEIAERGGVHACRVIFKTAEMAGDDVARALEIPPDASVFHVLLVHMENGRPVQIEDRHVNPPMAPGFLDQDFSQLTPSGYLLRLLPVTEIEHRIESKPLDAGERELLQVPKRESGLILNRRSWSGRQVVTCVRLVNPGSVYSVAGRFRVDGGIQVK